MIGEGTVNYAIARRLLEFSILKREYSAQANRAGSAEHSHRAEAAPPGPAREPPR